MHNYFCVKYQALICYFAFSDNVPSFLHLFADLQVLRHRATITKRCWVVICSIATCRYATGSAGRCVVFWQRQTISQPGQKQTDRLSEPISQLACFLGPVFQGSVPHKSSSSVLLGGFPRTVTTLRKACCAGHEPASSFCSSRSTARTDVLKVYVPFD